MAEVFIEAGTLTANLTDRRVTGLLLPFGEVGNTNLGKFSVAPGTVKIPRDASVVGANLDHIREEPVGRAVSLTETPAGIVGTFAIADTDEGDQTLLDIEAGIRTKLSAEVKNIVLRAGQLVSGQLFGGAFVAKGAFPSAALMAADIGDAPGAAPDAAPAPLEPVDGVLTVESTTIPEAVTVTAEGTETIFTPEVEEVEESPTPESETLVAAATVPNTLQAASTASASLSKSQVFDILHAIKSGRADSTMLAALEANSGPAENSLFAALSDVKYDGTGGVANNIVQPQWIGELYSGVAYEQQIVPLFNHADLTGLTINGFRWVNKPTGGTWTGNKSAIPSNPVSTEPFNTTAKRFAGGNDIAREHRDFNTPGFFESYYAAMAESYAEWVDETVVLSDILASATSVVADNPSGLSIGAGMSALIDGAAEVITAKAIPSFALVAPALWKQIMKTPNDSTLGYLSAALGLKDGQLDSFTIRPSSLLGAGQVLVGAREAATVYELPGVPIRVEAPDMIKGGIDTGVFGYAGTVVHKANALQLVTPYVAPAA